MPLTTLSDADLESMTAPALAATPPAREGPKWNSFKNAILKALQANDAVLKAANFDRNQAITDGYIPPVSLRDVAMILYRKAKTEAVADLALSTDSDTYHQAIEELKADGSLKEV